VGSRRAGPPRQSRDEKRKSWLQAFDHVVLLASVVLLLSLTYLLFVLLSGGLAAPAIGGLLPEGVRRNVDLARQIFLYALWAVVFAAMIRHYRTEAVGYLTLLAGAACWAAFPWVVKTRVPVGSAQEMVALKQSLIESFQASGGALVILGFMRVVLGRVIVLSTLPAGPASAPGKAKVERETPSKPSMMRSCWELEFCRPSLRATCPRYLERTSCWRTRSGCYCDQGLATRLLAGAGARARVQVAAELETAQTQTRQQYQQAVRARRTAGRRRRRKAPCAECPIYLDHQTYKYRVLSWFSYPAAAALIGLTARFLKQGYRDLEEGMATWMGGMQVLPDHSLSDAPISSLQWASAENAVVLAIALLAVSVILQLTEVAVFRFKW
jgi:hypothetical protein